MGRPFTVGVSICGARMATDMSSKGLRRRLDGAFPLPQNSDLLFDILENKTEAYAAYASTITACSRSIR